MAYALDSIRIGRTPLRRPLEDYIPCIYQPRRWDWVDPSKDMTAYEKEHGLKAISISEIIRKRGRDPDEVFNEIARDNEKMAALGLTAADVLGTSENKGSVDALTRTLETFTRQEKPTEIHNHIATPPVNVENHNHLPETQVNLEAHIDQPAVEARMDAPNININVEPTPVNIENKIEPTPVELQADIHVEPTPVTVENRIDNNKTIEFSRDKAGKITTAKTH